MIHAGTTGWPEGIASGPGDLISKEKKIYTITSLKLFGKEK